MLEVISDFKCARLDVKICEGDMRLSFLMLSLSFISHIKVWVIGVLLLVNIVCVTIWSIPSCIKIRLLLVLVSVLTIVVNSLFGYLCSCRRCHDIFFDDNYVFSSLDRDIIVVVIFFSDLLIGFALWIG